MLEVNLSNFAYPNAAPIALPRFALAPGEIGVLTGRSGAGKSTLIHLVTGVLALPRGMGEIEIAGQSLAGASQRRRDALRPHAVGWMPQRTHLLSPISILENILLPLTFGSKKLSAAQRLEVNKSAGKLLENAGIGHLSDHSPAHVSVGQAARVCIVRALVANPGLLCADEPSAALDAASTVAIAALFAAYVAEGGTALIASHDDALIDALSARSAPVKRIALEVS